MHTVNGKLGTKTRETGVQKLDQGQKATTTGEVKGDPPMERLDTPLRKVKAPKDSLSTKQCTATLRSTDWVNALPSLDKSWGVGGGGGARRRQDVL
jgi:hypothetical protein